MRPMSEAPVVFADANVLAAALRRHVLLALADCGALRLRWSDAVLRETGHAHAKIVEKKPDRDGAGEAARLVMLFEAAFPGAMVEASEAERVEIEAKLPDRGDEHVIQAAVAGGARVIVTENLRDFPARVLLPLGLVALGGDALFSERVETAPGAAEAVSRAGERLALNGADFADALRANRLKRTAEALGL